MLMVSKAPASSSNIAAPGIATVRKDFNGAFCKITSQFHFGIVEIVEIVEFDSDGEIDDESDDEIVL